MYISLIACLNNLDCILIAESAVQRCTFLTITRNLNLKIHTVGPVPHRQYCEQESDWEAAVALLDDGEEAGWKLLEDLFSGSKSVAELLSSPFLQLKP